MQQAVDDTRSSVAENVPDRIIHKGRENDVSKPKVLKKMVRANTPTSEQLASLNLKEGRNVITFTFSTGMLGKQRVILRCFILEFIFLLNFFEFPFLFLFHVFLIAFSASLSNWPIS